jgi:selenocysteine-specific elongation factor
MWNNACQSARARIRDYHQAHPESAGLPSSELRAGLTDLLKSQVPKRMTAPLSEGIVADLCSGEFVCVSGLVRGRSHRPSLPCRLQKSGDDLRQRLSRDGLNPPSRAQLCPNDGSQQALRFMIANGTAVELTRDVVVSVEAYEQAIKRIRAHLAGHGAATVSELKVLLASNRRVVVPLLERLDHEGVTRRDGDLRRLRELPPAR